MEQAGRKAVLPARVAISTERKKIEGMREALGEGKADVAAENNKNTKEKIPRVCKRGVTEHRVSVSMIAQEHIQHKRERRKS